MEALVAIMVMSILLLGIMAAQTTTAVVAERLIANARLLPADLRGSLQP